MFFAVYLDTGQIFDINLMIDADGSSVYARLTECCSPEPSMSLASQTVHISHDSQASIRTRSKGCLEEAYLIS